MNDKTYPEVTVGVLVFNQEGKVFLMISPKREKGVRYLFELNYVMLL